MLSLETLKRESSDTLTKIAESDVVMVMFFVTHIVIYIFNTCYDISYPRLMYHMLIP